MLAETFVWLTVALIACSTLPALVALGIAAAILTWVVRCWIVEYAPPSK